MVRSDSNRHCSSVQRSLGGWLPALPTRSWSWDALQRGSAGYQRFRVEARPKTTTELAVQEASPQVTAVQMSNVDSNQSGPWVKERSIESEKQKAVTEVI